MQRLLTWSQVSKLATTFLVVCTLNFETMDFNFGVWKLFVGEICNLIFFLLSLSVSLFLKILLEYKPLQIRN
jgi:hypothetical protein